MSEKKLLPNPRSPPASQGKGTRGLLSPCISFCLVFYLLFLQSRIAIKGRQGLVQQAFKTEFGGCLLKGTTDRISQGIQVPRPMDFRLPNRL